MKTGKSKLENQFLELTKKGEEIREISEKRERELLKEECSLLEKPLLELIDGCHWPVYIGRYGPTFKGDGLCYEFSKKYNFEPENIETLVEMLADNGKLIKVKHYGYDYPYEAHWVVTNYFTKKSLMAWFKAAIESMEKLDPPENRLSDYKLVKSDGKEISLVEIYRDFSKLQK